MFNICRCTINGRVCIPTENEKKIVLSINSEKEISKHADEVIFIKQGYTRGIRVREEIKDNKIKYILCVKQKINNRVIEIEKKIDQRDFNDFWSIAKNKLEKIRYILYDEDDEAWDIDYFKHNNHTYFALAEIEMPEGQTHPYRIPNIIKKYLIKEVEIGDNNFSSKKLSCIKHARSLID